MRLALRCIFCLSIVYAAILSHDGIRFDPAPRTDVVAAAPVAVRAVRTRLVLGLAPYCQSDPALCRADASRLNRLLEASSNGEMAETRAASRSSAPERRIRGAMMVLTP